MEVDVGFEKSDSLPHPFILPPAQDVSPVHFLTVPFKGSHQKRTFFFGLCPKLWVGGGQES